MGCCNDNLAEATNNVAKAIQAFTGELKAWRCELFPFPAPAPGWVLATRAIDQETIGMTTFMKYEDDLADLPAAVGRNKDIAKGVFAVEADGEEISRVDVEYDVATRKPKAAVPWKAPKGSDVNKKLAFVDDDGNLSPFTVDHFGIATDTIAPDAPTAVGVTRVIDEVEED